MRKQSCGTFVRVTPEDEARNCSRRSDGTAGMNRPAPQTHLVADR